MPRIGVMVDAFAFRPFVDCFYACYFGLDFDMQKHDTARHDALCPFAGNLGSLQRMHELLSWVEG